MGSAENHRPGTAPPGLPALSLRTSFAVASRMGQAAAPDTGVVHERRREGTVALPYAPPLCEPPPTANLRRQPFTLF